MKQNLPGAAGVLAAQHKDIWAAYAALGEAAAQAGGLTDRERCLVKLALSIGAASEGAVHSHTRRAVEQGISAGDLDQVALLAIGSLGLPRAVAARTWIEDITKAKPDGIKWRFPELSRAFDQGGLRPPRSKRLSLLGRSLFGGFGNWGGHVVAFDPFLRWIEMRERDNCGFQPLLLPIQLPDLDGSSDFGMGCRNPAQCDDLA